jgi:hypothetical protein
MKTFLITFSMIWLCTFCTMLAGAVLSNWINKILKNHATHKLRKAEAAGQDN